MLKIKYLGDTVRLQRPGSLLEFKLQIEQITHVLQEQMKIICKGSVVSDQNKWNDVVMPSSTLLLMKCDPALRHVQDDGESADTADTAESVAPVINEESLVFTPLKTGHTFNKAIMQMIFSYFEPAQQAILLEKESELPTLFTNAIERRWARGGTSCLTSTDTLNVSFRLLLDTLRSLDNEQINETMDMFCGEYFENDQEVHTFESLTCSLSSSHVTQGLENSFSGRTLSRPPFSLVVHLPYFDATISKGTDWSVPERVPELASIAGRTFPSTIISFEKSRPLPPCIPFDRDMDLAGGHLNYSLRGVMTARGTTVFNAKYVWYILDRAVDNSIPDEDKYWTKYDDIGVRWDTSAQGHETAVSTTKIVKTAWAIIAAEVCAGHLSQRPVFLLYERVKDD